MRWLKILLAVNGVLFILYMFSNGLAPSSYFLPADAPAYAVDAVRVLAVAYGTIGLIQIGMWWVPAGMAIKIVAGASLFFAAGFALVTLIQGTGTSDAYTQVSLLAAAGNAVLAALYAFLLYRERTMPAPA